MGYSSYNWIQTVSSSGEFDKQYGPNFKLTSPHIDGPRDGNGKLLNPLFIFGPGNPDSPHPGMTSTFSDAAQGETWFTAELTLIGLSSNGSATALGSFTWGYRVGNPNVIGPTFSTTPSPYQQGLINTFNHP